MTKIISQRIVIFIAISFYPYFLQAQTGTDFEDIGHFYDIDGNYIDGFLDIDYESENKIEIVEYGTTPTDYRKGYYFNLNGDRIDGEIYGSYFDNSFKFRTKEGEKDQKVKAKDCLGFVVEKDSFAVIDKYMVFHPYKGAQIIPGKKFLHFFKKIEETDICVYKNDIYLTVYKGNTPAQIPDKGETFRNASSSIFKNFDLIVSRIENKQYRSIEDLPEIIRLYEYKNKFDSEDFIYFDKYWNEIDSKTDHFYSAKIVSYNDSTWNLNYFNKEGNLLYSGGYSSFYPHIKSGEFKWFYKDGSLRKKVMFHENKPITPYEVYFENGNLHYKYKEFDGETVFYNLNDKNGNSLLDERGDGTETIFDNGLNRNITKKYKGNKLSEAYYVNEKGENIYLRAQINSELRNLKGIENTLKESFRYSDECKKDKTQGFILLRVIVNAEGITEEAKIIKGLEEDSDRSIANTFRITYSGEKLWKPAEMNGVKVRQEVILPINVIFMDKPPAPKYYNNFWMHNDIMNMHYFTVPVTPPSFPATGF